MRDTAAEGIAVEVWPWERDRKEWTHRGIQDYVLAWLKEQGLITAQSQRDLALSLCDAHFARYIALRKLRGADLLNDDPPMIGRRDVTVVLKDCNTTISRILYQIGIRPGKKSDRDKSEADPLVDFAEPA